MSHITVNQKRNLSHKPFFEDRSRWVISYGGAGSAKSYSTGQKILLDRIMQEPNHRYLVTRKVAKTLRVSVFQLFKDLISALDMFEDFKINKTDMTIEYLPNKSQLLFFGLDDIEKLKSIQGLTGIWVEEASETEKNDILELNRRLRGHTASYKQIILTFNPISHLHWLKEHFFDNPHSKVSIYKTTYKDNTFIDEEYKTELEDIKNYDLQQYNIYALGEWGILNQNIIHHRFKPMDHLSTKTVKDFHTLDIGIDFNIGGCVGVVFGEDNYGYTHMIDEFCVYDTEEIITELKSEYENHVIELYPDATGTKRATSSTTTDIAMLRDEFSVTAPKSNGSTQKRYNAVNRKFMSGTLFINKDKCPKSYAAYQTHAYDSNGKPEKFSDHEGGAIDDWTDAGDYCISRMFPIEATGGGMHKI